MKVIKTVLLCLLSVLFVSFTAQSASALSASRKKEYGYSGIYFYDPDWIASASSEGLTGCASISGGAMTEKIWNGLISIVGLSEEQAAGVMGNMQAESNFNPAQHEISMMPCHNKPASTSCGLGLIQWSFDRRTSMYNYVTSSEPALKSILDDYTKYSNTYVSGEEFLSRLGDDEKANRLVQLELEVLRDELKNYSEYSGIYSQTTVESAAEFFLRHVEKPKDIEGQVSLRQSNARAFYNMYHGSTPAGDGASSGTASSCSLSSGGMNLDEANKLMASYRAEAAKKQVGTLTVLGARVDQPSDGACKDGTLNNCSAFSQWFVNKYTSVDSGLYQGSQFAKQLIASGRAEDGGHNPRLYAVMSEGPMTGSAGGYPNHTGIVLGIDKENNKIIIGEASCSRGFTDSMPGAHEYNLSDFTRNETYAPSYAYLDNVLKGL